MPKYRATLAAGALATLLLASCEDVPLVPKWDAEWYIPLPTVSIRVGDFFPGAVILPGASADVSFPPQEQPLDSSIGRVLERDIRDAALSLTYVSTLPLQGADTLLISDDSTSLFTGARIARLPFSLAQTSTGGDTVSNTLSATQLQTLQNARTLWVQMRGSLRNPSTSPVVLTGADSIGLKLAMTVTIGISTR